MEHESSEQQKRQDEEQLQLSEHSNAANSGIPNVMATLGLGKANRLSPMQIEEIIFELSNPEWSARVAAVRKLSKMGTQTPVASLVAMLADEHEAVRSAAARALGNLGRLTPIEPLLSTLNDTSWHVRAASILALGKQRERVPDEPFIRALQDVDETVRAAAAWALGKQGERAPLAPLVAALHDPSWSVREAAVLALGERGGAGAVGPLLAARMDEDSSVRAAAETTLQQTYPAIGTRAATDTTKEDINITPMFNLAPSASSVFNEHTTSQPLNEHTARLDNKEIYTPHEGEEVRLRSFRHRTEAEYEREQPKTQRVKRRNPLSGVLIRGLVAAMLLISITASWLGISRVLRPPAGQVVLTAAQSFTTNATSLVVWSRDGDHLASVGSNNIISIWNRKSSEQQIPDYISPGKNLHVLAMNWSFNDLQLVALLDGQLKLIQIHNTSITVSMELPTFNTQSDLLVAWSGNGKHFVIASPDADNRVQFCDFNGSCQLPIALTNLSGSITALALSSDGTILATASDKSGSTDKNIQIWNQQGQLLAPFTNPTYHVSMASPIIVIKWSPQNDRLAYETNQGQLALWNRAGSINNSNSALNYPPPSRAISAAALSWSPDGKRLAAITNGKQIQIWDSVSGDQLYTSAPLPGSITDLVWSFDQKQLAITSSDGTLHIWNIS